MKNYNLIVSFVALLVMFGCIGESPLSLGGGLESDTACSKELFLSYFELVKNTTSDSYYFYVILADKCDQYQEVPAIMNFTIMEGDNIIFSKVVSVSKSDYKPYYSRISKKQIGGAYILTVPNEVIDSVKIDPVKGGYLKALVHVQILEKGHEKNDTAERLIKISNIPQVQ